MSAPDTARVTQAVRVLWELLKYWLASMAVCFCVLVAVGAFYASSPSVVVLILMVALPLGFFVGVPMLFYPGNSLLAVNFLGVRGVLVALTLVLTVFGFQKRQHKYGKALFPFTSPIRARHVPRSRSRGRKRSISLRTSGWSRNWSGFFTRCPDLPDTLRSCPDNP
ncbi:MAG: hypothetical protein LBO79_00820 [Zoogloeaceae bacterium]|jgi:hypothetical protein|nr:hypothetical protein [Zoogloeaceae bacterium]